MIFEGGRPGIREISDFLKINNNDIQKERSKSAETKQAELKTSGLRTHSRNQKKNTKSIESPQKCKIPALDPYHPDVKPHIRRFTSPTCNHPKLTEVTDDGFLKVN